MIQAKKKRVTSDFPWKKLTEKLYQRGKNNFNIASIALDSHQNHARSLCLSHVDTTGKRTSYAYGDLINSSNKLANALKTLGVKNKDHVLLFLPRIPEAFVAFFGVLKVKAVAVPIFPAFQDQALLDRITHSRAKVIITHISLLPQIKHIRAGLPMVEAILVVGGNDEDTVIRSFEKTISKASSVYNVPKTLPTDPAFMLYTSGSTGKPKGIVHNHGVIVQQYQTARWVFGLTKKDVYWCTADPGWITGVSYTLIAPLVCDAKIVLFQGKFDPPSWYHILEQLKVTVWYTSPTALRMLMASDHPIYTHNLSSLRLIASVGEPLNPEAIVWGEKAFGIKVFDTWYQTELGSMCIANTPQIPVKNGSMGKMLPTIRAAIVDEAGKVLPLGTPGQLVLQPSMPSFMRTVWKDKKKYNSYFLKGWYKTGDSAVQDEDGYFWFRGRADDLINTSGERVGPFEIESALLMHPLVVESGVVGKPDAIRGEIIKAFVVLKNLDMATELLKDELRNFVKNKIGRHAYPREITFTDSLPKTQSGKIQRRILRERDAATK